MGGKKSTKVFSCMGE